MKYTAHTMDILQLSYVFEPRVVRFDNDYILGVSVSNGYQRAKTIFEETRGLASTRLGTYERPAKQKETI